MFEIDMTYLQKTMLDLLVIPSVGGDCDEAMKRIAAEFEELGVKTSVTKKGALIGTIPGKDKKNHRVVTAHVDTLAPDSDLAKAVLGAEASAATAALLTYQAEVQRLGMLLRAHGIQF